MSEVHEQKRPTDLQIAKKRAEGSGYRAEIKKIDKEKEKHLKTSRGPTAGSSTSAN